MRGYFKFRDCLIFQTVFEKNKWTHLLQSGPFAAVIRSRKGGIGGTLCHRGQERARGVGGAWRAGPSSGKKRF